MEPRFKPGETVWILWQTQDVKTTPCPFCDGECKVYVDGKNGETLTAKCPKCGGDGELRVSAKWRRAVEKQTLERVQPANGIPPTYHIGNRWLWDAPDKGLDRIFGTEAEAQAEAEKWNAEQKEEA